MNTFNKNIEALHNVSINCTRTDTKQLNTLNRLRRMNDKVEVVSIKQHREFKKLGL